MSEQPEPPESPSNPPGSGEPDVVVVGAGLAGCEAAWQAARRGLDVVLHEMKPEQFSPAHTSPDFAELVCSNSLRASGLGNAVGLLKEEMRRLGSLVIAAADETAVPAGKALAVDRVAFARRISEAIESHPRIRVVRGVVERIPDGAARDPRDGPAHGARARARPARAARRRVPVLLRRDLADRVRRLDRPRDRLPRVALRRRRGRLPEPAALARRSTSASSTRCSPPRPCRCTASRRRSTSRAACRSRRWRAAGRARSPSDR